jgi:hypothetical protein
MVRRVVWCAALCLACAEPGDECPLDPEALCASVDRSCGEADIEDACGAVQSVDCGGCSDGLACSDFGQCIDPSCTPETDDALCAAGTLECGAHELTDRCAQTRTIVCGECEPTETCSTIGQCIDPACTPESDEQICARLDIGCGMTNAIDNCGQGRAAACGDPCTMGGDPGWLGEFEVNDPVYGRARESATLHTIDTGAHYVTIWQDGRSDGSGWSISDAIVGARVTYDGTVLDPGGIMIVEPGSNESIEAVLDDGAEIVLVTTERLDAETTRTIRLRRLDRDGRTIGDPVDVITEPLYQVQAAYDGARFVLAWIRDPSSIIVARSITPRTLALGDVHEIATPDGFATYLSLAVHDGRSMLSWMDLSDVDRLMTSVLDDDYAASVAGGVAVTDPIGELSGGGYSQAHTLWAAPWGYAMLHQHFDSAANRMTLHATFFDAAGAVLGAPLMLREIMPMRWSDSMFAQAATIGSSWVVAYNTATEREAIVIDGTTRAIRTGPTPLTDSAFMYGNLACHARECTVEMVSSFPRQARLDRYSPELTRTGSVEPAQVAADQRAPAIAFDGTQYLVMWSEGPDEELSSSELHVRRLAPDGRWLGDPIAITLGGELRYSSGAEAYPGGGFLVRWTEDRAAGDTFVVRRMNADGTWAWPPIALDIYSTGFTTLGPSACAGDRCLFTFTRRYNAWEYVILDGAGAALGAPQRITGLTNDRAAPAVAYDGASTFYVAFTFDDAIHVRTISTLGVMGTESYDLPAVAGVRRAGALLHRFDGDLLLLSSATPGIVEARTLTPGTGLSAPFTVADELPDPHQLIGASNAGGELHVIVLGLSPLFFPTGALEQLYRARYHDGVVEPAEPLMHAGWFEGVATTASAEDGLLAYGRIDWDVGFGGERIRLHFIGDRSALLEDGAACADDGQCAGGRCRSARCCDACSLWKGL